MNVRKLFVPVAAAAAATALAVAPANAGHCADEGPGHSDFGAHAQEHEGNEGGHYGWASCEEGARNSQGAPGQD